MSERQLRAALAGIAPFAEDDFYPNCATPEYRAAVEAMRAALAAPDAADAEVAALRADRDRMRAAIVAFATEAGWAAEAWKRQAHIAPLFQIAAEAEGVNAEGKGGK